MYTKKYAVALKCTRNSNVTTLKSLRNFIEWQDENCTVKVMPDEY